MVSVRVLLAALALCFVSSQDPCLTYTDEATCWAKNCNWCRTATVKPSCRQWSDASKLPPSVFACGNATRPDCGDYKDNTSCKAQTGCAWCVVSGVPRVAGDGQRGAVARPAVAGRAWMWTHRGAPPPSTSLPARSAPRCPPAATTSTRARRCPPPSSTARGRNAPRQPRWRQAGRPANHHDHSAGHGSPAIHKDRTGHSTSAGTRLSPQTCAPSSCMCV